MTPMSDILSQVMFENNTELVEYIIRTIIGIDDLKVIKVEVQKTLPGSSVYRSVRFDIFAVDSKGVKYDIEIQNDIADATPDRARFYLAMIDSHTVKKGIKKIKLNPVYIIFITKEDYFKGKEALYHFIFSEKDTHLPFNTEAHIIYLNLSNKTNKKLLDLQHDFMCTDPTDMRVDVIRRSANYYKNTEEGVNKMCEISKQIFNDGKAYGFNIGEAKGIKIGEAKGIKIGEANGIKIGEAKGIKVGEIKTYANMINNNLITLDQALSSLNMSTEEFVNLANQYKIVINCL